MKTVGFEYSNVHPVPQGGGEQERSLSLPVICYTNCSSAENELEKMENTTRRFSGGLVGVLSAAD